MANLWMGLERNRTNRTNEQRAIGVTRRDFLSLAGIGMASLALTACGAKESASDVPAQAADPNPAATQSATSAATTASAALDATERNMRFATDEALGSLSGETFLIDPGDDTAEVAATDDTSVGTTRFVGRYAEGKAVGIWTTSEYDEEWKTEHDSMVHVGAFGPDGKLLFEFTDGVSSLPKKGDGLDLSASGDYHYEDDRLALLLQDTCLVFDETGKLVFGAGRGYADYIEITSVTYHDGMFLLFEGGRCRYRFVDKQGTILREADYQIRSYNSEEQSWHIWKIAGEGLFYQEDRQNNGTFYTDEWIKRVVDVNDNVVLDFPTEFKSDNNFDSITYSILGGGLVVVKGVRDNPYGQGPSKNYYGIYDITKKDWAFGPYGQAVRCMQPLGGALYVELDAPVDADLYEADEIAFESDAKGLITTEGTWIINSKDDKRADSPFQYYAEGFWGLINDQDYGDGASSATSSENYLMRVKDGSTKFYDDFTWPGADRFTDYFSTLAANTTIRLDD